MDLTFINQDKTFNCRVAAIIINDNKLLILNDGKAPHYYLPGGRVQLGETLEEAIYREIEEEIGTSSKIIRPLWLNQAFFVEDVTKRKYHELCLYFLIELDDKELLNKPTFTHLENKNKVMTFIWMPFEKLEEEYFYPLFLKKEIFNLPTTLSLRTEIEEEYKSL